MSVVTVASDGHVDVEWECAVPCPECGEAIYALDAKYTSTAQFYIEDGDGVYDSEEDFGCQGGTVYYCPHCGKELFDNHKDALKFLLSLTWVPDLLPMPLFDSERVRRLPIEIIDGVEYYRDDRLSEYRQVDNPHNRIPFSEEKPKSEACLDLFGWSLDLATQAFVHE